jgi:hypothetical protein
VYVPPNDKNNNNNKKNEQYPFRRSFTVSDIDNELRKVIFNVNECHTENRELNYDAIMIFISSHGTTSKENQSFSIVTSDGEMFALSEIMNKFKRSSLSNHMRKVPIIVIVDACRGGNKASLSLYKDNEKENNNNNQPQTKRGMEAVHSDSNVIKIFSNTTGLTVTDNVKSGSNRNSNNNNNGSDNGSESESGGGALMHSMYDIMSIIDLETISLHDIINLAKVNVKQLANNQCVESTSTSAYKIYFQANKNNNNANSNCMIN